ncbi:MAG TPA: hypothetical protein VIJ26_15940 [Thermoanaerobaculia bacterium]
MNRTASRWSLVLLLTALFALLAVAQVGAQTPPAPTAPVMSTADFLATLSIAPAVAQDGLTPSPVLDSGCTSNAQCPKGQLCCLACGYAGCETRACFVPMNGHCPLFP